MKINHEATKNTKIYSSLRVLRFFMVDFPQESSTSLATPWNNENAARDVRSVDREIVFLCPGGAADISRWW